MPPTTIRTAPAATDYTPLSEHQTRTPETFFGGKPILHAHIAGATAWLPSSARVGLSTIFPSGSPKASDQDEVLEQKVDVFVGSDYLTLFNNSTDSGLQIPYPTIALHAVKSVKLTAGAEPTTPAIYMQLMIAPDEDEFETAELTVIPPSASDSDFDPTATATTAEFFAAISDCSNLHPDPAAEGEEEEEDDDRIVFEPSETIEGYSGVFAGAADGGLPPPLPGSGGWITAENVNEYFDAAGNYIGGNGQDQEEEEPEELGEGAGRVRGRDEVEAAEQQTTGTNGDSDTKRPRVE